MNNLPHLMQRIFGAPLAIHPAKFDAIMGGVGDRLGVLVTNDQILAAASSGPGKDQKYDIQEGIAIIPVQGSLMKKTYGLLAMSGCSSYETIGAQVEDAYTNPQVQGILLSIDSPGGETSGLFELCDTLASLKDKPVYAVADDAAYSAAYAIASCADRIYVTVSAGVGSIGVICAHVDQSGYDKKEGLKYTFIKAGEKKADGNSHEPLSESAHEDIQAEVDRNYGMFTALVAKNRGLSVKAVQATEAGTFFAENAVKIGLADKVGTFEAALEDLSAAINGENPADLNNYSAEQLDKQQEKIMAKKTELSAEEIVDLHAKGKKADDEYMDKESKDPEDDEDDEDDDEDDDDDDDEEGDDKKRKDDDEAKKGKKAQSDAAEIAFLCKVAGRPELATDLILSGASVADVRKALAKKRKTAGPTQSSAHAPEDSAELFRAEAARINADDKPDKPERFAKFMARHRAELKDYNKTGRLTPTRGN